MRARTSSRSASWSIRWSPASVRSAATAPSAWPRASPASRTHRWTSCEATCRARCAGFQRAGELVDALAEVRQALERGGLAWSWEDLLPPSLRPARLATLAAAGLAFCGLVIAAVALGSLSLPSNETLWVGATPALVMAALSLATLVVLALWARAVTRPARQLARAMAEVAQGRYGVRLGERPGLQRDGDFGQLFAMFDGMASALQQRQQHERGPAPTVTAMARVASRAPTRPPRQR
jgi:methyl-accepting chemotaxis protein